MGEEGGAKTDPRTTDADALVKSKSRRPRVRSVTMLPVDGTDAAAARAPMPASSPPLLVRASGAEHEKFAEVDEQQLPGGTRLPPPAERSKQSDSPTFDRAGVEYIGRGDGGDFPLPTRVFPLLNSIRRTHASASGRSINYPIAGSSKNCRCQCCRPTELTRDESATGRGIICGDG